MQTAVDSLGSIIALPKNSAIISGNTGGIWITPHGEA